MPTGRVKFYDESKGFGFISTDDGQEVFLHASAVPDGVEVQTGSRLEFGIAEGKRGAQALSVRVIEAPAPRAAAKSQRRNRKPADEMAVILEDLTKLIDGVGEGMKRGQYPDRAHGRQIAAMLRRVADELDA